MIEIRNIDNIITKGVLIAEYAIDIYIYIYTHSWIPTLVLAILELQLYKLILSELLSK